LPRWPYEVLAPAIGEHEAARGGLTIARMSQPPGGWRTSWGHRVCYDATVTVHSNVNASVSTIANAGFPR